ncbi:MAG: tRNA delta(2)-isopentenylpyrophosphate transferase [Marmoricola sp.]|nr:tRNA delta(2)-isopentenylpyrophosphate transferase [Marmoricola sp.]
MSPLPIVAVVGSTAAGKSELALDLAERLGGEIVNTDAMQVYRGMDIGTAKMPVSERRGITHHLMDVLDVTETASVADFQGWARAVIADCRAREVVPVLVGGSALYTRAIIDVFDFPGTDPVVRARYEARLAEVGPEALHAELATVDPVAASGMSPANGRRTVRALEVVALTGGPFTASLPDPTYVDRHTVQVGVDVDRVTLDHRIEQRVDAMWAAGLVEEVRELAVHGLREGVTASRALGYRQVLLFLDGQITESEARDQTVFGTRRFARRQDGWFRKDPRVTWVTYDDPARLALALSAVEAATR